MIRCQESTRWILFLTNKSYVSALTAFEDVRDFALTIMKDSQQIMGLKPEITACNIVHEW